MSPPIWVCMLKFSLVICSYLVPSIYNSTEKVRLCQVFWSWSQCTCSKCGNTRFPLSSTCISLSRFSWYNWRNVCGSCHQCITMNLIEWLIKFGHTHVNLQFGVLQATFHLIVLLLPPVHLFCPLSLFYNFWFIVKSSPSGVPYIAIYSMQLDKFRILHIIWSRVLSFSYRC